MADWDSKDPDEVLDYGIDFSALLESGEAIASLDWSVPSGLTLDAGNSGLVGNVAVAWLSGGSAGESYFVTAEIVTDNSPPRTFNESQRLYVRER